MTTAQGEYAFPCGLESQIQLFEANTTYAVVLIRQGTENVTLDTTASDDEDAGKASGFSIANASSPGNDRRQLVRAGQQRGRPHRGARRGEDRHTPRQADRAGRGRLQGSRRSTCPGPHPQTPARRPSPATGSRPRPTAAPGPIWPPTPAAPPPPTRTREPGRRGAPATTASPPSTSSGPGRPPTPPRRRRTSSSATPSRMSSLSVIVSTLSYSQAFTTGGNPGGYTLTAIEVVSADTAGRRLHGRPLRHLERFAHRQQPGQPDRPHRARAPSAPGGSGSPRPRTRR